jgi:SAM-dependent methyltransferase
VNYYLANPVEAGRIARAGQARTLRDHTYAKRMAQTAEILDRHLRYRREAGCYQAPDAGRISWGHTPIGVDDVTDALTDAWKDAAIPSRQRALVQAELAQLYRGNVAGSFRALADLLSPRLSSGDSLLEIGCASGYYYEILEYLTNRRIDYTGADYSPALIGMARDYYPNAAFVVADGARLPFPDRSFRFAISSGVLLHVTDYRDHIAENCRVASDYAVAHRTPVCRSGPTRYLKKFAYGVETVEIELEEREILEAYAAHGFREIGRVEFASDPAKDLFQVSYLFERVRA